MRSLDDIHRRMEAERQARMRAQQEAERQQREMYERQRQYMLEQRRMYEKVGTVAPSSAASNSSSAGAAGAAGAGGGRLPIPVNTDYISLPVTIQTGNVAIYFKALDTSVDYTIDFGDGTTETNFGTYSGDITHTYASPGNYTIKVPYGAKDLTLNSGGTSYYRLSNDTFVNSTGLKTISFSSPITSLEPGVFDNGTMDTLVFAYSKISTIKNGVFNNIANTGAIMFTSNVPGVTIDTIEDGAFLFDNRPVRVEIWDLAPVARTAVDSMIENLYDNSVTNLTMKLYGNAWSASLQTKVDELNANGNNITCVRPTTKIPVSAVSGTDLTVAVQSLLPTFDYIVDFGDGTDITNPGTYSGPITHTYTQTAPLRNIEVPEEISYLYLGSTASVFKFDNYHFETFVGSESLTTMVLDGPFTTLVAGMFDNGAMQDLTIRNSAITTIPTGVFNNFATGGTVSFDSNTTQITTIQDGAFLFNDRAMTVKFENSLIDSAVVDSVIDNLYANNVTNLTLDFSNLNSWSVDTQDKVDQLNANGNNITGKGPDLRDGLFVGVQIDSLASLFPNIEIAIDIDPAYSNNDYVVDFGDGTTETRQGIDNTQIGHTYTAVGGYTTSLPKQVTKVYLSTKSSFVFNNETFVNASNLTEVEIVGGTSILVPGMFDNGAMQDISLINTYITNIPNGVFNNLASGGSVEFDNTLNIETYEDGAFIFGENADVPISINLTNGTKIDAAAFVDMIDDIYANGIHNFTFNGTVEGTIPSDTSTKVTALNNFGGNNINIQNVVPASRG